MDRRAYTIREVAEAVTFVYNGVVVSVAEGSITPEQGRGAKGGLIALLTVLGIEYVIGQGNEAARIIEPRVHLDEGPARGG